MEIFRSISGGLASAVLAAQPPLAHWRSFEYCLAMTGGRSLGSVDHFPPPPAGATAPRPVSPAAPAHLAQSRLLPLLLRQAQAASASLWLRDSAAAGTGHVANDRRLPDTAGAGPVVGPVLMGHRWTSVELRHGSPGVTATVATESSAGALEVSCRHFVAADGAGSGVRAALGMAMDGDAAPLQRLVNVHFASPELGARLLGGAASGGRPAMLYFVFNPDVVMVVVAHDLAAGDFVAQIPFYPPQQRLEDFTVATCTDLIRKAAGVPGLDIAVREVRQWAMTAQVAAHFQAGAVFLAGDAAHRFPPAGGFGMNTGIQDAHNLAWKLAMVHQGLAPEALLDTYDAERRPVASTNASLSVANYEAALAVPRALGLDPAAAALLHSTLMHGPLRYLPLEAQRAVLEQGLRLGRAQLESWVLSPANPIGAARLAAVRSIIDSGQSLRLQFPAEDLGFQYSRGALLHNATDKPAVLDDEKPLPGRRREYRPRAEAGCRLPHAELVLMHDHSGPSKYNTVADGLLSTLDLLPGDKLALLLLVSATAHGKLWCDGFKAAATSVPGMAMAAVIWPPGTFAAAVAKDVFGDGTERAVSLRHVEDLHGDWWAVCGVPAPGALLVRPDGHVGWHCKQAPASESAATDALQRAISSILCLNSSKSSHDFRRV
eukprot:SM000091S24637  [mRNA]  locus=s91:399278:402669:- [translate_table: standard]